MPQCHLLDKAVFPCGFHIISLTDLAFYQHEQPGNEIPHQILRAEADSNTRHARGSQQRRNGKSDFIQSQQHRNADDHEGSRMMKYAAQGFYPAYITSPDPGQYALLKKMN